jgi:16S rRNA (guanine966-N2)-methyltransferase
MRIISGEFKGRRFIPPAKNWPTRPTTDIAKEGLFNILQNRIDFEDTIMLDLFGGTGSHCYEFISRGCKDTTYVDTHGPANGFVKSVSIELGIEEYIQIHKMDVYKFIASTSRKYDYIFCGPPYALTTLPTIADKVFDAKILAQDGVLVIEHDTTNTFKNHKNYVKERNYGMTIFSFFEYKEESSIEI